MFIAFPAVRIKGIYFLIITIAVQMVFTVLVQNWREVIGATPYSISDHVKDLEGLLDHLSIQNIFVCGLSVGGLVAQSIATRRKSQVKRLVLCDTAHKIGTEELWNSRIQTVQSDGFESLADSTLECWFTRSFHESRLHELAGMRNMLVRQPAQGYAATCVAAVYDALRGSGETVPGNGNGLFRDEQDRRWSVNGYVKFDALKVGLVYLNRKNEAGMGSYAGSLGGRSDLWTLNASYQVSPAVTLDGAVNYMRYKDAEESSNSWYYIARATYSFSKRTAAFASAAYMKNKDYAANSAGGARRDEASRPRLPATRRRSWWGCVTGSDEIKRNASFGRMGLCFFSSARSADGSACFNLER